MLQSNLISQWFCGLIFQDLLMQSRYAVINLQALRKNFIWVRSIVGSIKIMAIVKANGYGHGLLETARIFQEQGADYFGVAFIDEAIKLRQAGIKIPILVLGGIIIEQIPLFFKYNIEIMASSIDKLQAIADCAQACGIRAKVHLKIDTGLGRIGVRWTNAREFFQTAVLLSSVELVGVATHFATADEINQDFMQLQCQRFEQALKFFTDNGLPMPLRHAANSGAILQFPESYFDMVRPGIILYGVYPQSWMSKFVTLIPALSLYAKIVYFKVVEKGSCVSYGLRWTAPIDSRVITLPIGYGDGYPRVLSNKGLVLYDGSYYPIVGTICMDQMMVNIGTASAFCSQEVVFVGKSKRQVITVNQIADWYQGSPYEFLVGLNERIDRLYQEFD